MNVVAITGRLVRDPELRHTPSGMAVANMRLAVDRAGQKEGDEIKAGFFDVTSWGDRAEWCAQYLGKGSRIEVSGELRFREWEAKDDGGKRTAVEINAFRIDFGETRAERQEREGGEGGQSALPSSSGSTRRAEPESDFGGGADDDIPF